MRRRSLSLLAALAGAAAFAPAGHPNVAAAAACPGADPCPWTQADTFGDVGDGEFRAPIGMATDSAGNLYVVENDMNRVQKLGPNGAFVAKWGSDGTAEGHFQWPGDIAVDAAHGAVYVVDTDNNRVQKFDTAGNFVSAWGWGVSDGKSAYQVCTSGCRAGIGATGNGAMSYPRGIATDGTNVYVADTSNQRIEKFGIDGSFVASWAIGAPKQNPERVAVAGGKVYVTTTSAAVWRFDTSGVPDSTWDGDGTTGTSGHGAGQLEYPEAIAVDGTGVYVADSNNERIAQFDLTGAFVRAWGWGVADGSTAALQTCTSTCQAGILGAGTGQFNDPYGILATGGEVWVADSYNHRIQQFTTAGAHVATVGGLPGGKFYYPTDVAIAPSGDVYVADYSADRIQRLSPTGSFLSLWTTPYPVSVTPANGDVYATTLGNRVRRYDTGGTLLSAWGSSGPLPGQFAGSYGTAADAAGNIYVAERGNNRVQKFDAAGNSLALIGTAGSGDGQLKGPRDVAIDADGNVYVADSGNNRVEKFDATGAFVATWGTAGSDAGQFSGPAGIAIDARGHVFVSDTGNNRIEQFDRDGTFVTAWGAHGSGLGQLYDPDGLAVDDAGAVWVADDDNHRIARFCCPATAAASGAAQGSGGPTSTSPAPSPAAADTVAPRITLGGRRTQRAVTVRRRGLRIRIGSDEAARVSLTVAPLRRDARRLALRASIGRATVDLSSGGARIVRIRLSVRARRALVRARVLRVVVRAHAVDRAGNRAAKSLTLTIAKTPG